MTRGLRMETDGMTATVDSSQNNAAAMAATINDVWQRRWFIFRAAIVAGALAPH